MGRGNVCTLGKYEGLYYIDNDHIHVYRDSEDMGDDPETRLMGELDYEELTGCRWLYDEEGSMNEEDDILECFMDEFSRMFPSFKRATTIYGHEQWLRNGSYGNLSRRVILESKLFYIAVEDNMWSLAVELIQKEEPWGDIWMANLQKRLYEKYLEGMKKALLTRVPSIYSYGGAWTPGKQITREEVN